MNLCFGLVDLMFCGKLQERRLSLFLKAVWFFALWHSALFFFFFFGLENNELDTLSLQCRFGVLSSECQVVQTHSGMWLHWCSKRVLHW